MTLDFEISPSLAKKLNKLAKKDITLALAIRKKIQKTIETDIKNIEDHYKNLKYDKSNLRRVHVGSFVLTFEIKGKKIIFNDFDHHDKIYV